MFGNLTFRDVERLGEIMLAFVALAVPVVTVLIFTFGQ
jgi:hypothetical protein